VAAAYRLRGTLLNRVGGATRGIGDFEQATQIDPFDAQNFYFLGEALRRAGKPQEALVRLKQAFDRLREPAFESEYRLKIRLTQIELGEEQEFVPEMAQRLAENPPPPDWLLTAAAVDMEHRDFAAAATHLERARQYMDKQVFALRMRDYFFYSYRIYPPLARFFAVDPTAVPAPSASETPKVRAPFAHEGGDALTLRDNGLLIQGPVNLAPKALPAATP
jgi:tetratricopeptide (TPR) repeat protein